MMMTEKSKERDLHELFEDITISHKKDVAKYTSGHLNESHLWKPSAMKSQGYMWEGSQKPPPKQQADGVRHSRSFDDDQRERKMVDRMTTFAMGTGASIMAKKPSRIPIMRKKGHASSLKSSSSNSSIMDDGIFVEELRLPGDQSRVPKLAVTKRDQYDEMKQQHLEINQPIETTWNSSVVVDYLTSKLRMQLSSLEEKDNILFRLQIHSKIFLETIEHVTIYRTLLSNIKIEYDTYVTYLLDSQPEALPILHQEVSRLTRTKDDSLDTLKQTVSKLEEDGRKQLAKKEQLLMDIEREKRLAAEYRPKPKVKPFFERRAPAFDKETQVATLQNTIWEKLDAINSLKAKLRGEYVPAVVHTTMQQNVRDAEVEIQKLTRQNEYLKKNEDELREKLAEGLKQKGFTFVSVEDFLEMVDQKRKLSKSSEHLAPAGRQPTNADGAKRTHDFVNEYDDYFS